MPIDTHAHYVPPALLDAVSVHGGEVGVRLLPGDPPALEFEYGFRVRPFFRQLLEPAASRRAWLAQRGLNAQIVGTWPDIFGHGLAPAKARAWHRLLNDTLAEWCTANGFAWIASVPLPAAEDAASELERAAACGAVGAILPTNVEGTNLGELELAQLWARAERLDIPVLLHPVMTTPAPRARLFALAQIAQYPFDTTLGLGSLIFSGVLDRFPRLSLVLSHGGGAFPFLAGRFDVMHERMDRAGQGDVAQAAPSSYARRLAFDTIVHAPGSLRLLAEVAGLEQIVLGTDCSFPPADLDPVGLLRRAGLTPAQIEIVSEANPRRIFARLARE